MEDRIKPSFAFQRDSKRPFGALCKYSHSSQEDEGREKIKPCFVFQRGGRCRFGERCRYSHVLQGSDETSQRPTTTPQLQHAGSNSENAYRTWVRNIPSVHTSALPLGSRLQSFFQDTRRLVKMGSAVTQDVVTKMASEGGRLRIKELLERPFQNMSTTARVQVFVNQVLPFFDLLTLPEVLDSLVLEKEVTGLYNFVFGINGGRATPLFTFVAQVLDASDTTEPSYISMLEPSIVVFCKILDFNTLAGVQPCLTESARQIEQSFSKAAETHDVGTLATSAVHLRRLLRHLDLGHLVPTSSEIKKPPKAMTAFPIVQDPPGGRHDNDFADICQINILPTTQEIRCGRSEYLPDKDPSRWHLSGLDGLLDRNFRLLREDTVGQLRDAIQQEQSPKDTSKTAPRNKTRTNLYRNASISQLSLGRRTGFCVEFQLPQPVETRGQQAKDQEDWWQRSKRLQSDALVCLTDTSGTSLFFTVVGSPAITRRSAKGEEVPSKPRKSDQFIHITLSLVEQNDANVQQILERCAGPTSGPFTIVEFPGVLLPAFDPTLRALQKIKRAGDMPFFGLLAPSDATGLVDVPTPAYMQRPGYVLNLKGITKDGKDLHMSPVQSFDLDELIKRSSLDRAQASALVQALSHEFNLIQGPPGTGKSYTGVAALKVLLANRKSANIGPILCITYTNHALDQLGEDLLDSGITERLLRIGSQSKSERLQNHNLLQAVRNEQKTRVERATLYQTYKELEGLEKDFGALSDELRKASSAMSIARYLKTWRTNYYDELFGEDEDGFQRANNKHPERVLQAWLQGKLQPNHNHKSAKTLNGLSKPARYRKYNGWIKGIRSDLEDQLRAAVGQFRQVRERQDQVQSECELRCLRQADIVMVTTSGLARKVEVFRRLKSKVLLCEEAGEVLEAHLLAAFLPSLEHVILIGDHLQLRPQVQNFLELSREGPRGSSRCLDVSLFERLVRPDVESAIQLPFSALEIQRRMHPSISQLIRNTLYPSLIDHESVIEYPLVTGMRRRLFWFDHEECEASAQDDATTGSHWNAFEIDMVTALVTHLVQQGVYKAGEIAVLTPYLGQLHRLRRRLQSSFAITMDERDESELAQAGLLEEDISPSQVTKSTLLQTLRVATVDNFQGEEAKVVVISLVRSNTQRRCGFLKTSNRINVLLSRAKHGMYILGDAYVASGVKMWADVVQMLQAHGNIGREIELHCPRHPEKEMRVSRPDGFTVMSPEGGCNERCVQRLPCGHACLKKCHSDLLHRAVHCLESCQRPMQGCDHPCPEVCGDRCPERCIIVLEDPDRRLQCGHPARKLQCWEVQDLSSVRCPVRVERKITGCGHTVSLACHRKVDEQFSCPAACSKALQCGHSCRNSCHRCRTRAEDGTVTFDHGPCTQICERRYATCSHACKGECHANEPCAPCASPCDVRCGHSKCSKQCNEPCIPCAEEICLSQCEHSRCTMPCAAPCDNVPCSIRCRKILECGHQCPSLCGEACPDRRHCQLCANEDLKARAVDFLEGKLYSEVNLDETPCIFPSCGHFLTIESMDGLMSLSDHYEMSPGSGIEVPFRIKSSSKPFCMNDVKTCPMCRGSLRNLARYGRLVRRALLDETTKKLIIWSNGTYVELAGKLSLHRQLVKSIEEQDPPRVLPKLQPATMVNREDQVHAIGHILGSYDLAAWGQVKKFRARVRDFRHQAQISEQPFSKVRNAVDAVRKRTGRSVRFQFDEDILQTKGHILSSSLLLRLDLAILVSFLSLKQSPSTHEAKMHINLRPWQSDVEEFLADAISSKRPSQQVEAHIYLAQLYAVERSRSSAESWEDTTQIGMYHLEEARKICDTNPQQTRGLIEEVEQVQKMLNEFTFYSTVTNAERQAVIDAMATEMRGTGHWYYCVNGHPFTIGECGMPMVLATCPECSAPVGGQDHEAVAGITHATDLESQFGGMRIT